MASITIPDETYRRLSEHAKVVERPVDELIRDVLDQFAKSRPYPPPLTGEAWLAAMQEWRKAIEERADRYPPGFVLDDSRETMYREREDAQL
ncbi:MAG: ribbon-helix-helix protein, CopG family [Isosphaeraceae bacterium]